MTEPRDVDIQCDHPCDEYLMHRDCACVRDQRPIPPRRGLSTPLPLGRPRPVPRLTWVEFDEEES
jgi:hypothetical protein